MFATRRKGGIGKPTSQRGILGQVLSPKLAQHVASYLNFWIEIEIPKVSRGSRKPGLGFDI